MRGLLVSLTVLLVVTPGLVAGLVAAGSDASLVINEVMPNPVGSDSQYEWVELYNSSAAAVELSQWQLGATTLPNYQLQAYEYVVLARDAIALSTRLPEASIVESTFSLPNSGGEVAIISTEGSSAFNYPQSSEGISFELLSGDCNTVAKHPNSNSGGAVNTPCDPEPVNLQEPSVFISRVEAAPTTGDEWLELTNLSDEEVILDGLTLKDASGKEHPLTGLSIQSLASVKIFPKPVSLNNDGDTITLFGSEGRQVDVYRYSAEDVVASKQKDTQPIAMPSVKPTYGASNPTVCSAVPQPTVELERPRLFRLDH
ncbi:MAG: lamin tail domain-containing protein [Candidatus Dojkabacteria bacterium]